MVRTPYFQCRGHNPWSVNQDSTCHGVQPKNETRQVRSGTLLVCGTQRGDTGWAKTREDWLWRRASPSLIPWLQPPPHASSRPPLPTTCGQARHPGSQVPIAPRGNLWTVGILSVYLKAQKFVTCVGNLLLITSLQSADRKIRANVRFLRKRKITPSSV